MIMAIIGYYLRQRVERDLFVLPRGGVGGVAASTPRRSC